MTMERSAAILPVPVLSVLLFPVPIPQRPILPVLNQLVSRLVADCHSVL